MQWWDLVLLFFDFVLDLLDMIFVVDCAASGDLFFIGCYGRLTGTTAGYGWPVRAAKVHPRAGRMVCFPLGLGSTIAPLFLYPKH